MLGVLSVEWINMQIDKITFAAPYWIHSYHGMFTPSLCRSLFKLVDISSNLGPKNSRPNCSNLENFYYFGISVPNFFVIERELNVNLERE